MFFNCYETIGEKDFYESNSSADLYLSPRKREEMYNRTGVNSTTKGEIISKNIFLNSFREGLKNCSSQNNLFCKRAKLYWSCVLSHKH